MNAYVVDAILHLEKVEQPAVTAAYLYKPLQRLTRAGRLCMLRTELGELEMFGILAVWNDRSDKVAADYERWYMTEHIPERLGVPGFRTALRYEAIDADRQYFTFYELDSPAVLASEVYLERLANPTEQTRTIMPDFLGMIRSVFVEASRDGRGVGGAAVVIRYGDNISGGIAPPIAGLVDPSEITGIRIWNAAPGNAPTDTAESRTRPGRDEVAGGAVVIETARAEAAQQLVAAFRSDTVLADASVGCYRLLYAAAN